MRFHDTTFGEPKRDAVGQVADAVFMLIGPGQPPDATRYDLIFADNTGRAKPSECAR